MSRVTDTTNSAQPKSHGVRALKWLLATGLALSMWVVADNWGDLLRDRSAPAANTAHSSSAPLTPEQIEQGRYLALAGNCMACHTTRGGTPWAGGRRTDTPFGGVYSSNLTPDPDTGLGRWTAQDFWKALHRGRSKDGRLLAPAFPYNHTSVITRPDSDAIFAWLNTLPPVVQAQPAHTLVWPVGTQPALAVWRSLFFEPSPFQADKSQTAEWNRGAYLVQGLGHCAACHSPRNALGASGPVRDLSGGLMPVVNWYAPDLTHDAESGLASTPLPEIVRLLRTGGSTTAQTSGPMGEVVQHSLQHLKEPDLQAMAIYLQSRAQSTPQPAPGKAPPPRISLQVATLGGKVYENQCLQCHGEQGEGVKTASGEVAYPALAGNRAVLLSDPTNLVQLVLYGGYGPATQGHPRPFGMPPAVLELQDRDIAAVLTHLRSHWGNRAGEVTPLQVNRIRAAQGP
ncbi:cytochrome c [Limnohabitans sp.]|jgi:mono/diheme cytochrome c family protein|uniref:c-type cytochrome n=1 Tax=Limnohabitans sp. TaxID=1907725 RepID=UPI0025E8DEA8|nr:cytochrome c [Limnohabitans sp.]